MSDQNIITDWVAYFTAMGPASKCTAADFSPMFPGAPNPHIVMMKDPKTGDLETLQVSDGENLFDRAKDAWESNSHPEMWLVSHTGGSPWRCPAAPKRVHKQRK